MSDKELLTLAAKAAGYDKTRTCVDEWFWVLTNGNDWHPWNPLTDDGDALRLAVKLNMDMRFDAFSDGAVVLTECVWKPAGMEVEYLNEDPYAATRRAIVRAAAEIGRGME